MAYVLLVEDNHDMLMMLAETLRLEGHEVVEAVNGREALAMLQQLPRMPQIVVTDVNMPVMDGWALLAQMRTMPESSTIPCMMLSGDASDRDIALARGAGAFLLKPFRHSELMQMIADVLG